MKALTDKKAIAISMRQNGAKQAEIVKELNVSKGIVSAWLKNISVPPGYYEKIYTQRYGHPSGITYVGEQGYITCNMCKQSKKIEDFLRKTNNAKATERNAYRSNCKVCNTKRISVYNKKKKLLAISVLGGKCPCGCNDETMLEIHHNNKNGKEERKTISKDTLRAKIAKMTTEQAQKEYKLFCIVCHEAEHAIIDHPNAKYEIKYTESVFPKGEGAGSNPV
jgi:predicted transcriptional regulator